MAKSKIFSLIILSLLSLSTSVPSQSLLNAAETLSNSGYIAMSLTLELISPNLISQPQSATIFSPPDSAFAESGQPSLSLLHFHFSPLAFSLESLRTLPYGTKIPTMFAGQWLVVTTKNPDYQISLNNVTISGSPIFDDGSLIVFGIENFFYPNFTVPARIQSPNADLGCVVSKNYPKVSFGDSSLREASGMLKSRGYSVMASFLELRFIGSRDQLKLTVFAPVDEVMVQHAGDFPEYSSLFLRHVLPCKLSWTDLVNFDTGTEIWTYLEGFTIKITRSGDIIMVNEVPVTFPDMYYSDWLVVHGLREILLVPESTEIEEESSSETVSNVESIAPDRVEF